MKLGRFLARPIPGGHCHERDHLWPQSVGLQAYAKHFILNERETQRNPSFPNGTTTYSDAPGADIKSVISNADDRIIHEL
jgi:beta-glucosidase